MNWTGDRKAMSTTRPSLAADASPDAYAEAMVKCQGYAPSCSDACECLNDGFCFSRDGYGFNAARSAIAALVADEPSVHTRVWLKLALDALDQERFLGKKSIDVCKVIAINRRVRKDYGAAP